MVLFLRQGCTEDDALTVGLCEGTPAPVLRGYHARQAGSDRDVEFRQAGRRDAIPGVIVPLWDE